MEPLKKINRALKQKNKLTGTEEISEEKCRTSLSLSFKIGQSLQYFETKKILLETPICSSKAKMRFQKHLKNHRDSKKENANDKHKHKKIFLTRFKGMKL